ncbi:hypothetical protein JRQ81_011098 [Phrynocephalus forsythii]|uniref:Profilin n=1 Tax=Phrynocephalus forsythii TaxID=171643 RepID=A0A9Q0XAR7_9SAUR|nr:hypothetical protein JRQ81_011098 [Phrynocephalus forsythii]
MVIPYVLHEQMSFWKGCINFIMRDTLCYDAAFVSVPHRQLLCACPEGILAQVTKPEIESLFGSNREVLLTQGLTLGGLKCVVVRDNLCTKNQPRTMDLRMTFSGNSGEHSNRAITVVLINPVGLILVGQRGVQGGTLSMMAFQAARYIKDNLQHGADAVDNCQSPGCKSFPHE